MKVLVHFEHHFYSKEYVLFRTVESVSRVFDVKSKRDLLKQLKDWDYVPSHLRDLKKEIRSGKKIIIWYLPETLEPHF